MTSAAASRFSALRAAPAGPERTKSQPALRAAQAGPERTKSQPALHAAQAGPERTKDTASDFTRVDGKTHDADLGISDEGERASREF